MMNRAIQPDYTLHDYTDMALLERQMVRSINHLDPILYDPTVDYPGYGGDFSGFFSDPQFIDSGGDGGGFVDGCFLTAGSFEPDPLLETGWPSAGLGFGGSASASASASASGFGFGVTSEEEDKVKEVILLEMMSGPGSLMKRKFDNVAEEKVVGEMEDTKEKKIRGCEEEEGGENSKITEHNTATYDTNTKNIMKNSISKKENLSNDSSKLADAQKMDFIHVRARRGQATDSHSLAERVRREKISERMKYLQDLVPGCNKISGKAGMLDEIINYVQSLQRQVEFLSMKLATVNPRMDFNIYDIFTKEVFSAPTPNFPNMLIPSSEMVDSGYFQLNPMQQLVSCSGTGTGFISSSDLVTTSCPLSISGTLIDSSCFNNNGQAPPPMWDSDMHNLCGSLVFDHGRSHN